MSNPYKRMYVLSEDEYKEFKRYKATKAPVEDIPMRNAVKCPKCGRDYPNENILAHHLKSHYDGFKCNICGKVFKQKGSLTEHLNKHPPQVEPSKYSVLDNHMPQSIISETPLVPQTARPTVPSIKVKPHKHRCVINFTPKKWLTLK